MSATNVAEVGGVQGPGGNPMFRALRTPDFRLLWIGQGTSSLGDQFTLIALPWLVLQLTGNPLALGIALALEGIPRALFMLLGGAISDRFSSRTVMLASDLIRLAITALLAVMAFTAQVQMWMLYAVALAFGVVSGFFTPAANSIVPTLVAAEDLQGANAISMGTMQLTGFVGPMLAGALIALFSGRPGLTGIALAFAVDAISFVASLVTLWLIEARPPRTAGASSGNMLAAVGEGIRFVWRDAPLRMALIIFALAPLLSAGPVGVGIPVLAKVRLPEGVAAFGIIMGGYAAGNLLGYIAAGTVKVRRIGLLVSPLLVSFGLGIALFGLARSTLLALAIAFTLGAANGYFAIVFFTWVQSRTPPEMLGRMMSLLFTFNLGLTPLSQALAGAIIKLSLTGLFLVAGALTLLLGLWSWTRREVLGMEM